MLTTDEVFLKIKEISLKYLSGNPPLDIESIAMELSADPVLVRTHITSLEQMGLVTRHKNSENSITLTAHGQTANLP